MTLDPDRFQRATERRSLVLLEDTRADFIIRGLTHVYVETPGLPLLWCVEFT